MSRWDWAAAPLRALGFVSTTLITRPDPLDRRRRSRHGAPRRAPRKFGRPWFCNPPARRERGPGSRAHHPRIILFGFAPPLHPHARVHLRLRHIIAATPSTSTSGGAPPPAPSPAPALAPAQAEARATRTGRSYWPSFCQRRPFHQAKVSLALSPSCYPFLRRFLPSGGQVKQRESCFSRVGSGALISSARGREREVCV